MSFGTQDALSIGAAFGSATLFTTQSRVRYSHFPAIMIRSIFILNLQSKE